MTEASPATDPRPTIVICTWDESEGGWDLVEDLSGRLWSPPGARTVAVAPGDRAALAQELNRLLADRRCRALLLVGRTRRGDAFQVQLRAEDRSGEPAQRAPSIVRATAPAAEIKQALLDAGLSAGVTSEAEDDAGSWLLHRILTDLPDGADLPAIGLLRAPERQPDADVQQAVRLAASAMARQMAAAPRGLARAW